MQLDLDILGAIFLYKPNALDGFFQRTAPFDACQYSLTVITQAVFHKDSAILGKKGRQPFGNTGAGVRDLHVPARTCE